MAKRQPLIYIFALIGLMSLIAFFTAESIGLNHIEKIIASFLMFIFFYLTAFFLCLNTKDTSKRKKIMKIAFGIFVVLYFVMLMDFTLVDTTFGRNISNILSLSRQEAEGYLKENTNIIPFKTVKIFTVAYRQGTLSVTVIIENILGNFFVLMPLTLFLVGFFKRMQKTMTFIFFCSGVVIIIEALQLVFLVGSADIDDFILNISGAMVMHYALKAKKTKEFMKQITFGLCGE